jgi:hypothetical protein
MAEEELPLEVFCVLLQVTHGRCDFINSAQSGASQQAKEHVNTFG